MKPDSVSHAAFPKSQYSEHVVRNALYWLSEHTQWVLTDDESCWHVRLLDGSFENLATLNRLLNDFRLREDLDRRTQLVCHKRLATNRKAAIRE